jgi:RNA polymerase sigma-70 factor, ECF subfamily
MAGGIESQLIGRTLQGDETAVADLVARHGPAAFRLALSILDDPVEAEEAAQDAWLNALGSLDSYRAEASFQTWLFAITLNVCRARLRKRQRRRRLEQALIDVFRARQALQPRTEEDLLHKEREDRVFQSVQRLGDEQRLAIILRYYHAMPMAEIARVMQVSERTVYARLRTAYERLRADLESSE